MQSSSRRLCGDHRSCATVFPVPELSLPPAASGHGCTLRSAAFAHLLALEHLDALPQRIMLVGNIREPDELPSLCCVVSGAGTTASVLALQRAMAVQCDGGLCTYSREVCLPYLMPSLPGRLASVHGFVTMCCRRGRLVASVSGPWSAMQILMRQTAHRRTQQAAHVNAREQ